MPIPGGAAMAQAAKQYIAKQYILPTSGGIPAQLFAALNSSSDDAIVAETLDGVIASWNPGAVRLYGYTADYTGTPRTRRSASR
jgi:PAS domain-containing protein